MAAATWEEAKAKGNAAYGSGKLGEAIDFFTQAIKLDPGNSSGQLHIFFSNRSAAQLASGNAPAALQDALQCLKANPSFAKGHSRQGAALFRLARFGEAAAAYDAGLALEPGNAEMRKAAADARNWAEAEHRPLPLAEARPKIQAHLARNALAARLALPRMLLLLAAALYIVPFFLSRAFSFKCYSMALAAGIGSHLAALYSRHGMPKFQIQYLAHVMQDAAAPYLFLCMLLFSFRRPYPLGLAAIVLSEGVQLLWLFSECVAIARPAAAKRLSMQWAGLAARYTQNPRYAALSPGERWQALFRSTREHCAALEVATGVWLLVELLTPARNFFGVMLFWQYLQMRFMLDQEGVVKAKFKALDTKLLSLSQHPRCPGFVATLYGVVRGYCQRAVQLPDPQQAQAQQQQAGGGLGGLMGGGPGRCAVM